MAEAEAEAGAGAGAEAGAGAGVLSGQLTRRPRLGEKEKAGEVSAPSLSSVPSTTLQDTDIHTH